MNRTAVLVGVAGLLAVLAAPGAQRAAAVTPALSAVCGAPTVGAPDHLAGGTYSALEVTGFCAVDRGPATVLGDVVVDPGGSLVAAYALDAGVVGTTSGLTVDGDLSAGPGATVVLGCDAVHLPCLDDPGHSTPTLDSSTAVHGSLAATDPLGVVLHHSTVDGDLVSTGGGGGVTCAPDAGSAFSLLPNFGAIYSDYEDLTIGGNLRVTGLASCWIGALRLDVHGSASFAQDTFADPDADEILNDTVDGNLQCVDLTPAVHFGDAGQGGSTVGGYGTGDCAFSRMIPYPHTDPVQTLPIATHSSVPSGYWLAADDGGIFSFGVPFGGSAAGPTRAIGAVAASPGGIGYQLASGSGTIFAYGARPACTGSIGNPNQPVVGMAAAPGGDGCWLVASDGGVFTFGSGAAFYGSAGALRLNRPVVGMASAPNGDGYSLVAADGGIFSYGPGAAFEGSMGGRHLNLPIVGMAVDPSTGGYWLVASDGGIFSFGAPFFGSLGAVHLNRPIVGMAAAPGGDGYYLVASDGGVFAFGSGATFRGSTGDLTLNRPVIGMALG
jgi:hypothetical protein